ncbi:hypothetical protein KY285_023401 [Solanum tuberosum]|nr:hypothetical protein KY289_023732 [Solanum tuberosum]KAH0675600.1 hypothetical protein KY285_023401 [Solanum tuberosum]
MDSSIVNEIYVFPQICNAKRGSIDSSISEKVKWDGIDKILESKDDLIQQVLEFVRTLENFRPPLEDDDTIRVNLIFVKKVFVPPEEFELTKMNIIFNYYENIAAIIWNKVCDKIKGYLGQDSSSLYEEFQCLKDFMETIVRETTNSRTYFNEDCERALIDSLVEVAKREFMSLPAVRSIMQYLHKVDFIENELTEDCSICMSKYLPGSEAYNMPCNHSFHSGCIGLGF